MMAATITQKVVFKNTSVGTIYNLYLSSKKHAQITGAPASINAKVGTTFTAHGDYITGKNLQLIKDKLIVQSWRASDWQLSDMDSVFIIQFEQKGKDCILNVVHANVPVTHAKDLDKGWHEYYWEPMKAFLSKPVSIKTKVKKKK